MHNEQVMLRLSAPVAQAHGDSSEVGRDGKQVVAEREGEKKSPHAQCCGTSAHTEWLKWSRWLPGAGL